MTVSVIIPAYNEEESIEGTVKAIKGLNIIDEIIVVDDGSTDETYSISENLGVNILSTKHIGKGGALKKGVNNAKGDIIVFLDADLKDTAKEVKILINAVKNDLCDVAVAKFPKSLKKSGFGFVKKLSKVSVKILTGEEFNSVLSGQRAFKRNVLSDLEMYYGYSLETGMTIDIINKGYIIKEFDVDMCHRVTKRNIKGFIHRGKQFLDIFFMLIKKY